MERYEDSLPFSWYCSSCSSAYPKPTKFEHDIEHDKYRGYDIRSQPQGYKKEGYWVLHIDFTPLNPLNGDGRENHEKRYLSRDQAHIAGFGVAYDLIDEQLRRKNAP